MKKITILVTGATGRIGKHLVKALLKNGEKVRVLIRKSMTEFEDVETFYGDVLDKESLKKAVDGVNTIFHLAAVVDYTAPENEMFNVNVIGTKNLLEVFKGEKFIYLSSTAVLGKKLKKLPADESTPYSPSNFYGRTKMEAEKIVKENGGMIIRSPDVLMPRFIEGYDMIFSRLLEGKMPIIGDGKNFIDYINIRDLIKALLLVKERGKRGEIYVVAGKGVKTQRECLEIASRYLGVESPKKQISTFSAKMSIFKSRITRKNTDFIKEYIEKIVRNRSFDTTKAKNELGFEADVDMETSIREMVEDYLERSKEKQEEISDKQSEQQS